MVDTIKELLGRIAKVQARVGFLVSETESAFESKESERYTTFQSFKGKIDDLFGLWAAHSSILHGLLNDFDVLAAKMRETEGFLEGVRAESESLMTNLNEP